METVNKFRLDYVIESYHYFDSCMPFKYVSAEGEKTDLKMGFCCYNKKVYKWLNLKSSFVQLLTSNSISVPPCLNVLHLCLKSTQLHQQWYPPSNYFKNLT